MVLMGSLLQHEQIILIFYTYVRQIVHYDMLHEHHRLVNHTLLMSMIVRSFDVVGFVMDQLRVEFPEEFRI